MLFFIMLAFSCQLDSEPELQEQKNQLEIVSASDEAKDLFDGWIGNINPNARTGSQYSSKDMIQINHSGRTRYAAPKVGDPNTSISFVIDRNRNIDMSFIRTSIVNRNQSITSKMYSLDNRLIVTFVHNPDGTLKEEPIVHGFWEWLNDYDDCLEKHFSPFDSTILNMFYDTGLTLATRGAWLPFVLSYCAVEVSV